MTSSVEIKWNQSAPNSLTITPRLQNLQVLENSAALNAVADNVIYAWEYTQTLGFFCEPASWLYCVHLALVPLNSLKLIFKGTSMSRLSEGIDCQLLCVDTPSLERAWWWLLALRKNLTHIIVVDSLLLQARADVRVHGYFIYFQDGSEHPMWWQVEDSQATPNSFEVH